jgi:inosine-uridine nucleoside N-ribohydrolase
MDRIRVLLDTDIGTDIDDAVCLAYLLSNPRCDLLGITTVTGEAEERAKLASALCRRAGREIPIFPGTENPFLLAQRQTHAAQAAALGAWPHQTDFPHGEAIEFLRRSIRKNPGEVVLLTIAPLTNIGLLFSVDPEIPSLLRGLVMMCGRFLAPPPKGYGPVEWNAIVDAHATSIVYSAPVRLHRSIGLDVTSQVSMSREEFRSTFKNVPLFAPVLEWAEIWFKDWPGTTFHDPLAAATIFEPSLCTYQRGKVGMCLTEDGLFGETRWTPGSAGSPHEVAIGVDPAGFFHHYVSVVRGK